MAAPAPNPLAGQKTVFQINADRSPSADFADVLKPGVTLLVLPNTSAEEKAKIEATGAKVGMWDPEPSAGTAAQASRLGVDVVSLQVESSGQLPGAREARTAIKSTNPNVSVGWVTNHSVPYDPGLDFAQPEAYAGQNPRATPDHVVGDARNLGAPPGKIYPVIGGEALADPANPLYGQMAQQAAKYNGYGIYPPDPTNGVIMNPMFQPTINNTGITSPPVNTGPGSISPPTGSPSSTASTGTTTQRTVTRPGSQTAASNTKPPFPPNVVFTAAYPQLANVLPNNAVIAVKVGGTDAAKPEDVAALKAAGYNIAVWQSDPSQEGVDAIAKYGAVAYIGEAESDANAAAYARLAPQITTVPKAVVTPVSGIYGPTGRNQLPADSYVMVEAYPNQDPNTTPKNMIWEAMRAGAKPSDTIVLVGAFGQQGNFGGVNTTIDQYAQQLRAIGVNNFATFSMDAMTPENKVQLIQYLKNQQAAGVTPNATAAGASFQHPPLPGQNAANPNRTNPVTSGATGSTGQSSAGSANPTVRPAPKYTGGADVVKSFVDPATGRRTDITATGAVVQTARGGTAQRAGWINPSQISSVSAVGDLQGKVRSGVGTDHHSPFATAAPSGAGGSDAHTYPVKPTEARQWTAMTPNSGPLPDNPFNRALSAHGQALAVAPGDNPNNILIQMSDGSYQSYNKTTGALAAAGTWGNSQGGGVSVAGIGNPGGVAPTPTTTTTTTAPKPTVTTATTGGSANPTQDPTKQTNPTTTTAPTTTTSATAATGAAPSATAAPAATTTAAPAAAAPATQTVTPTVQVDAQNPANTSNLTIKPDISLAGSPSLQHPIEFTPANVQPTTPALNGPAAWDSQEKKPIWTPEHAQAIKDIYQNHNQTDSSSAATPTPDPAVTTTTPTTTATPATTTPTATTTTAPVTQQPSPNLPEGTGAGAAAPANTTVTHTESPINASGFAPTILGGVSEN